MQYGNIPGVDKPISRLAQGTMMIGSDHLEQSFELLDAIHALGCNTFDTAHVYGSGDVERTFGRWMKERGNRNELVIIGKGAHHNQDRNRVTPFDIMADIHDSLARLQVDSIDLYLLHRDDPTQPVEPIVDVLNEEKEAGRIDAFGGSNWTVSRIQEANAYAEANGLIGFAASSPNFSLAKQVQPPWPGCVSIGGPAGQGERAWYEANQFPLFTWSSLAGGFFSGRFGREKMLVKEEYFDRLAVDSYGVEENFTRLDRVKILAEEKNLSIPQVAMAYVMNAPMNIFALVGCRTANEFQANLEACTVQLTQREMAWLELRSDER